MKRTRLALTVLITTLILTACHNPQANPFVTPTTGKWDSSASNEAQWE